SGVDTTSGPLSTATAATTPVLDVFVAPVHLDLLGAVVDTTPIHLTITANSGQGLVLGNVVTLLANLFNPPLPDRLDLDTINARLAKVVGILNASSLVLSGDVLGTLSQALQQLAQPNLVTPSSSATAPILNLTIASTDGTTPPVRADLLGLVVTTSNINAQLF